MRDFVYRWRTTISVVFAAGVFVLTVGWVLYQQSEQQERNTAFVAALVEERVTSAVNDCHQGNEFRTSFPDTLRHIVELSEASGSSGIDLTSFPAYLAINDPSTREYLAELERRLNAAPEDEGPDVVTKAAEDYERDFPVLDCKVVERELREDLAAGGR